MEAATELARVIYLACGIAAFTSSVLAFYRAAKRAADAL